MIKATKTLMGLAVLALAGCDSTPPATDASASATPVAPAPSPAPNVDAEYEQVKAATPLDACALLTPEKLASVFPALAFDAHQKLEPRMSGYAWDSRCVLWAGVGSHAVAKDVPTHTVELFVNTVASVDKAEARLAARHDMAKTGSGYQPQPNLGTNAYVTVNTGVASLYFVKGQAEVQLNLSDLETSNDEKIQKLAAIAQLL